jgi:anaerobic ribonucleoside-triphosphate reductase activating protein
MNKLENLENVESLRIAGVVKESTVDGPGFRYVIFTQGCPHKCEGCHNPETHDFNGGKLVPIDKIVQDIKKNPLLAGVTISGGDPLMQAGQVAKLIDKLDKKLTVMVYTGFTYEYLLKNSDDNNKYMDLLERTDILMDGKFVKELMDENLIFRGSSNQRAIDVKKSLKENKIVIHEF